METATKVSNSNDTVQEERNILHIPKREATVIPETPEKEVRLPVYLKKKEEFFRIDAKGKYINVWMNKYTSQISSFDYGDYLTGEVAAFIKEPHNYEIITEQQFTDAFATAMNQISNAAYGAKIHTSGEDNDEDYSSCGDEEQERRIDLWMDGNELNELNPDE